jgi:hypothetical protein
MIGGLYDPALASPIRPYAPTEQVGRWSCCKGGSDWWHWPPRPPTIGLPADQLAPMQSIFAPQK